MDAGHEDRFVVFVRSDRGSRDASPPGTEQPLAACATYAEARRLLRACQGSPGEFVIRYVGETGGGD